MKINEGRVKQSAKNMISGFLYQTVTLILSFISRTVFINTLGTEYLGLNGIFTDVLSLLSMADLGFGTAMAYSFYKPLADHDEDRIAALIHFYKKVYHIIAVTVTVLGLLCVPFLKYIVNTQEEIPNLTWYYLFSLANIVISYLFVYKTTLMTADQKDYKIVNIRMWATLTKTILQILALYLTANYMLYIIIGVQAQFLTNAIASWQTQKEYPYIRNANTQTRVEKEVEQGIFNNMKSVFIYKLSGTLFSATDNLLISMLIGTAAVGLYSNYLMLSNKLLLIEQIIFSSLVASIGNVIARDSPEKRLQIFQAMQSASFIFCGIITAGFGLLANDVITVWLGKEYTFSMLTVIAVTVNTYFSCALQPLWIYRDATGLYMKTKYMMLAGAIVNIVLSVILGRFMGIAGIIFASAIARLSTYFWYEPKLLFHEYFNSRATGYYISILKNIGLLACVIAALSYVFSGWVVTDWMTLILKVVVTAAVCSSIFVLAYCRTEGFQVIMNKVRQICGHTGR